MKLKRPSGSLFGGLRRFAVAAMIAATTFGALPAGAQVVDVAQPIGTELAAESQVPLRNVAESVMYLDGARQPLGEAALIKIQDAALERPISEQERRELFTFLNSNNGTLIDANVRDRIMRFVNSPATEIKAAAVDAERNDGIVDAKEAAALLKIAESEGMSGAEKYTLEILLGALQFDAEAAAAIIDGTAGLTFSEVLKAATADGTLSDVDYFTHVRPVLMKGVGSWTAEAEALANMYLRKDVQLSDAVRRDLASRLEGHGFGIRHGQTIQEVLALHVSAPDRVFADLAAKMDLPSVRTVKIGVIDGGFDLRHDYVRSKIATNDAEIPGNDIDDDGDGLKDNYYGANFVGLAHLRPTNSHAELSTDGRLMSHHGNQTSSIAGKGSDRVRIIPVAGVDGSIAKSIHYAVEQGATVINISQGITLARQITEVLAAIDAHEDVLFVHSAGNGSRDVDALTLGSEIFTNYDRPNLIHVAAAEFDGTPHEQTNTGKSSVHVAAQAKFFGATLRMGGNDAGSYNYQFAGKTSQASPNVANLAAKMQLLAPSLSPEVIKGMIIDSAPTEAPWADLVASQGRFDAERAMAWASASELVHSKKSVEQALAQLELRGDLASFVRAQFD